MEKSVSQEPSIDKDAQKEDKQVPVEKINQEQDQDTQVVKSQLPIHYTLKPDEQRMMQSMNEKLENGQLVPIQ